MTAGRAISPRSACVGGVTGIVVSLTPHWYHGEAVAETAAGGRALLPINRSQADESLIVCTRSGDPAGTEPFEVVRAAGRPPAHTPSSSLSLPSDPSHMLLDAVAVRLTPRSGELGDSRSPPGVGVLLGLTFHSRFRPGMTTAGEAMEGSLTQPVFQRLLTLRDRDEHARKFSITTPG